MRKLFFFVAIFFLLLYLFFKSGAWVTYKEVRTTQSTARYVDIRHEVKWDRFFDYLVNLPRDIVESLYAKRR